jgi:hypothetical protein
MKHNPIFGSNVIALADINNTDLGSVTTNGGMLLAAGPLNKQPGTVAHRMVLVQMNEGSRTQFVVWQQNFPNFEDNNPDLSNPHMHQGEYFHVSEFDAAVKEFARRLDASATFLRSLYNRPQ